MGWYTFQECNPCGATQWLFRRWIGWSSKKYRVFGPVSLIKRLYKFWGGVCVACGIINPMGFAVPVAGTG